jgi:hypothetical protein
MECRNLAPHARSAMECGAWARSSYEKDPSKALLPHSMAPAARQKQAKFREKAGYRFMGQVPPCMPGQPAHPSPCGAGLAGSPPTAKVDSSWTTSLLPHDRHEISAARLNTRCSNRALQLRHSYSNNGTNSSLLLPGNLISNGFRIESYARYFFTFPGRSRESVTEASRIVPTTRSDGSMRMGYMSLKSIFTPMNESTIPSPMPR